MKALPIFIENSPLYELLALERHFPGKTSFTETHQRSYPENKRKLVQELRHEKEIQRQV